MGGRRNDDHIGLPLRVIAQQQVEPGSEAHIQPRVVVEIAKAQMGQTHVEGLVETPSGRRPRLRSVWLVETGKLAPRFITAYPLPA